jgi:hypothetical protein
MAYSIHSIALTRHSSDVDTMVAPTCGQPRIHTTVS